MSRLLLASAVISILLTIAAPALMASNTFDVTAEASRYWYVSLYTDQNRYLYMDLDDLTKTGPLPTDGGFHFGKYRWGGTWSNVDSGSETGIPLPTDLPIIPGTMQINFHLQQVAGYQAWWGLVATDNPADPWHEYKLGELPKGNYGSGQWFCYTVPDAAVADINASTSKLIYLRLQYGGSDCHVTFCKVNVKGQVTPEPCTLVLLAASVPAMGLCAWRRRKILAAA